MLFSKDKKESKETTTFNINLEKESYSPGDIVKGTLVLVGDEGFKAKGLKLEVYGEEKTKVHTYPRDSTTYKYAEKVDKIPLIGNRETEETVSSSDTFYYEDLSSFLKSTETNLLSSSSSDETIKITTAETRKEITFQFTIPGNVLESYAGKNVWIDYKIKAVANRSWKQDITEQRSFIVLSPNKKPIGHSSHFKLDLDKLQEKRSNNNTKTLETEEDKAKDDIAKLEVDSHIFSPGDIIKGKLYLLDSNDRGENENNKKTITPITPRESIKNIEIKLNAIERATSTRYKEI
jgi:hypothetical protein